MSVRETSGQTGDWLIDTVKRNPEALLVLAAGCALLMRGKDGGNNEPRRDNQYHRSAEQPPSRQDWQPSSHLGWQPPSQQGWQQDTRAPMAGAAERAQNYASDAAGRVADTANQAAGAARQFAADIAGKTTDAAGQYGSAMADYAGKVREAVSSGVSQFPDQARSTVQQGFARILREQPLAIAALGLAAGATIAAVLPVAESESKVLGPAHDAVFNAAARAADNVRAAAGEAGEQLKQAARDRGLHPEGLKDLARDVAGSFADNVAGRSTDQSRSDAPGLVPESATTGSGS